jgi:phosphatidylserine/phosphatidylglycerophosphate/cardiolipin synthase-like enzyme
MQTGGSATIWVPASTSVDEKGTLMKFRVRSAVVVCLLLMSCRSLQVGGTYPGLTDESREVTFPQLAEYYRDRSSRVITPAVSESSYTARRVTFRWDPYDKLRIRTPYHFEPDSVQRLFQCDVEGFVARYTGEDLLAATYNAMLTMPFSKQRQVHIRPYRSLAAWGSLCYPPIRSLPLPLSFYHRGFAAAETTGVSGSAYFDPEFQIALDHETETELTYGNTLTALFNGEESFPAKLRLAAEAQKYLYVAVMTLVADETGRDMIRVMIDRKRAGVDVRLITDDFYTFSISQYAVGVLEREGIPVAHVADKRLNQFDRMFHNKFWIRDGEEAILGGMNFLDYENESNGFNFMNRDTDVLIRGPAVTNLLGSFIALWKRYDKHDISIAPAESTYIQQYTDQRSAGVRGAEHYARWLGDPATRLRGICRTAVQGDGAEPQRIVTLLTRYLEAAQHSFYITSPGVEFALDNTTPTSVDILAGVMLDKVRLPGFYAACITNGTDGALGESTVFLRGRVKDSQIVGDQLWEDIMTPLIARGGREVSRDVRRVLNPLIEAGLHGFQYFNYVHAKEFYFDRLLVGIGSWNFDLYSAENNHECVIFCLDESLRRQMERQLVLDMVNSTPIVPASLLDRLE